jgi:DNA polymerase-1
LYKIKSTYLEALLAAMDPHTKKIHTSFSQTATATGRLASSDPNVQNIPVSDEWPVRSAFKAAENHYLISADYSQIELRVLAHISQDPALIEAFKAGHDIHAETASGLFNVPLAEVDSKQRSLAKTINFSILYGLSAYGLARDLDIPQKEAQQYIERYFAHYPKVVAWMDTVIEFAKDHGYVQTLWGRRRYVPGIYEKNRNLYELARRVAINTVVQGTAAELMKKGMLELDARLKQQYPSTQLLLQIHDELIIQTPAVEVEPVQALVKSTLETIVSWNIPLLVSLRHGSDWQEITK